jgi:predicted AAA+ superfamily ATPase
MLYDTLTQEVKDRLERLPAVIVPRHSAFKVLEGKVSVAIGVRRCGKTYLMYEKMLALLASGIPLSRILYINFEDDRLQPKTASLLSEL